MDKIFLTIGAVDSIMRKFLGTTSDGGPKKEWLPAFIRPGTLSGFQDC